MIDPSQDAFGMALLDYLEGQDVPELVLEDREGGTGPAMRPEWFFRSFAQWDRQDRKILAAAGCWPGSRSWPGPEPSWPVIR